MKVKKEHHDISYVWVDENGIIGQPYEGGVEGGDSACWNGHYKYFRKDQASIEYVKTFEVGFGAYVRHPYPHPTYNRFGWYYKNPWDGNITVDQLTGICGGVIAEGDWKAMLRIIIHSMAWLCLFDYSNRQNGKDPLTEAKWRMGGFMSPKIWQMMLRGFGKWSYIFYPLLCVFDLHLIFDTIWDNFSEKDDRINDVLRLSVARDICPTPVGWLAVKLLDRAHTKERIAHYWLKWRDNPGMYDIHSKAIDDLK